MAKMWTSNEEFDFETARDQASKLVLLAGAHRAGIFNGLLEEKDLATLKRVLKVNESNYCLKRKNNAKIVLDLWGGPGKYSKAFVNRGLNAVLYDLPDTIDYVKSHFDLGNIKNLTLKKGDFTTEFVNEFDGESFDIVFMGNICHIYSEKENMKLIGRASKILGSNGMIAIEDFVRGRSPMAEMFAVNMLANTEGGNTYTEAQYREWLTDAGFQRIEVIDLSGKRSQLITAFWG